MTYGLAAIIRNHAAVVTPEGCAGYVSRTRSGAWCVVPTTLAYEETAVECRLRGWPLPDTVVDGPRFARRADAVRHLMANG